MTLRIPDLINAPWAILPEKLEEIRDIYERYLHDEPINAATLAEIEARVQANPPAGLGDKEEDRVPYEIIDDVGIIPVRGIISRRINLLSIFSGGISTELLYRDFLKAVADPQVAAIVLAFDTPGGAVGLLPELGDII
jgi:ClpP class serine protease